MNTRNLFRGGLLSLIAFLLTFSALGQEADSVVQVNLSTPYHTIYTHLYFLQPESYAPQQAAAAFDVENAEKARRLALQLKQIMDGKGLFVQMSALPREADYRDSTNNNQETYELFPGRLPQIYLERKDSNWYYSEQTVQAVPGLHAELYPLGADFLLKLTPRIGQERLLGLKVWQYVGMLLLFGVLFLVHLVLSRVFNPLVGRLLQSRRIPDLVPRKAIHRLARYLSVLLLVQVAKIFLPTLQLPVKVNEYAMLALSVLTILLIVFIGLRLAGVAINYLQRFTTRTESKMDEQLVPILKRTLQGVVILAGLLQILTLLEVNVTALIAGISIGGIALALAAQDTVKNLIGSATIFVDQPFQIGDWIEGSGFAGTVVEVGFRTTRIQPIDTSIISVPNGQIMNMSITNLGARSYRLFATTLGVTYDTPPDLLEVFLKGLERIILEHPHTRNDPYYVRLNNLADSSLSIMFRAWIDVPTYAEEQKVREELIFSMLRLAEYLGVSFAFPSTSVYLESTPERPLQRERELKGEEALQVFMGEYQQWLEGRK